MKLKSKLMAAAIALVAASGANAAITNGAGGNGELFFNIWDANGSYTLDLNMTMSSFQDQVDNAGLINLAFAADPLFGSFMDGTSAAGTRAASGLKFNLVANDSMGARTIFTTFTEPAPVTGITNSNMGSAVTAVNNFIGTTLIPIGANQSLAVNNGSTAWAGKSTFKDTVGGALNFSNAGGIANNSYATGLSFMSINGGSLNNTSPVAYNQMFDEGSEIHVYLDASNALHIQSVAAIPEPSEYALMLAGLGMLGFMARRRLNNRA